jgi:flagella basal body P-ring formation protein FlgA
MMFEIDCVAGRSLFFVGACVDVEDWAKCAFVAERMLSTGHVIGGGRQRLETKPIGGPNAPEGLQLPNSTVAGVFSRSKAHDEVVNAFVGELIQVLKVESQDPIQGAVSVACYNEGERGG